MASRVRFTGTPGRPHFGHQWIRKEQVVVVGHIVRQAAWRAGARARCPGEERNGTSPPSRREEQFHRWTAIFPHFSRRILRNFLVYVDSIPCDNLSVQESYRNPSKIFRWPVPAASFAPILRRRRRRMNTVTSVFFMAVRPSASFERTVV